MCKRSLWRWSCLAHLAALGAAIFLHPTVFVAQYAAHSGKLLHGFQFACGGRHPPRHYGERAREKLRHFLHPTGKRIHVATDPEEAQRLRLNLSRLHHEDEFDVYISGTPEHLEAVRQAREHHEGRRAELMQQHAEVYERFRDVHNELDLLSNELERVTTHGVSLEAHFDRFGYSARIRSYEDEDEVPDVNSGISTPRSRSRSGDGASEKRGSLASGAESSQATSLKLLKRPILRQYFHKGILWRASRSEEVQSFELFVDLLYVGILQINGDAASEDPTGLSLLRFVITFTLSYKIWNDMAQIISWFETDDIVQRFSIVFLLVCLFGYTTNITQAFVTTYPTLIGFYLCSRLFNASYLLIICFVIPTIKPVMLYHVLSTVVGAALWIGSIYVSWPNQLIVIWMALLVDLTGAAWYLFTKVLCERVSGSLGAWFEKTFQFWPAVNIEHRTERMNAFVTLVFGYTVVALLYQSTVNGIDAFFGKAVLGLIQAFCFNWLYFEVDGSNLHTHAIRRAKSSAMLWSFAHLPFIMAFVLGGSALSRLVVATDTTHANVEDLTETYQVRSEHEIRVGTRWFYCAGFALALACMGLISLAHVHKEISGLRLKKRYRLAWRFCIAIVLILLPLAEDLDSIELVGTVTALIVFALGTELWAASSCQEKWCERSRPCQYVGRCGKGKLHAVLMEGKNVDVSQLASGNNSQDGLFA
ncbi:hypothetical protein BAUCODRAFT_124086 [Baudoinia panamericana UAMH 10762]|uniref:Uncharacterized protein n=1 Tax=Baudoinia panamericana (strain UAMH 10762) TaxID=717646 RepID=M2N605_BAUPA|nr:uncharacterized protein BAUCODRAFT_124086 [Baudoinia panamericana UAMH 10762]EMC94464.1 hypothetical protein BAUCODRAFT_124086 [Baudoinia panamericana UAMH 10762]